MDAVSQYRRRVYRSIAAMSLVAAATWPLWGFDGGLGGGVSVGRLDRVWGLALGIAAGVVRLGWTFYLARRLASGAGSTSGPRYARGRLLGFVPLAAALAVAGLAEGVDLYAAAFGVILVTATSIAASVLELRAVAGEDRSGPRYGGT